MAELSGADRVDPARITQFMDELMEPSGHPLSDVARIREIDRRIGAAGLSLADKAEVVRRLVPRAEDHRLGAITGERRELRLERLFLSVDPADLSRLKFALEYDRDYKDVEEYVFHDVDDKNCRARIIEHFRKAPGPIGVKVLTDVDDTMYANLIDARYPRKTLYPGVLDFYDALRDEPFAAATPIPITTLSARPNPIAGKLEEDSLGGLVAFTAERLAPSGLSGSLGSSVIGTVQSVARDRLDHLSDEVPDDKEVEIGEVKFRNFASFSAVYPEYRFVFVGDSGQADALTARRMITDTTVEGTARVITTFIHDLRTTDADTRTASRSFRDLPPDLVVGRTSAAGRGVVVFRNYIEAAAIAHAHAATLPGLITAEKLARVTRVALQSFQLIDFAGREEAGRRLRAQYRAAAEDAVALMAAATQRSSALEEDQKTVRTLLASF